MIWRWLGALVDAWLALSPVRRRLGLAWRGLPGDAVGLAVVRLCGVDGPARRVTLPDGTEGLLFEDPRLGRYLDNVPLRPYAQTLGRIIVAREPIPEGTIRHELEHVRQWSRLGPLFLPLYGLESCRAMLMGGHRYHDNRFELAARSHEPDVDPEVMVHWITRRTTQRCRIRRHSARPTAPAAEPDAACA